MWIPIQQFGALLVFHSSINHHTLLTPSIRNRTQMQYSIPIQPVPVYQQEAPVPVTVVPASQPVTVVPAPQPVTAPLLESQIPYAQPIPMAVPVQPVSVYFFFAALKCSSVDGTHSAVLLTK